MAGTIMDEIKESFRRGSSLTKLIYINIGVFVAVKVMYVIYFMTSPVAQGMMSKQQIFMYEYLDYLMVSSDPVKVITRPWTIITYMFLHWNFIHILFNILILYWFGRIFLRYLTEKQLMTTYILGGIIGALFILLFFGVIPALQPRIGTPALGASAAVMAITIAISVYAPNYTVYLMFFGPVKIKYIALFYVVLDILMIASENAGGHIAHLGGALYGYLFAVQIKKGKDMGGFFNTIMDRIATLFKHKSKMKVTYKGQAKSMTDMEYNRSKAQAQKEIDRILDKIAKSGYDSLTKKEKETLFKMSK